MVLIRAAGLALPLRLDTVSPLAYAELRMYAAGGAGANRRASLALLGLGCAELGLAPLYQQSPDVGGFAELVWSRLGAGQAALADVVAQVDAALLSVYAPRPAAVEAPPAPTAQPERARAVQPGPVVYRGPRTPPAETLPEPEPSEAETPGGV